MIATNLDAFILLNLSQTNRQLRALVNAHEAHIVDRITRQRFPLIAARLQPGLDECLSATPDKQAVPKWGPLGPKWTIPESPFISMLDALLGADQLGTRAFWRSPTFGQLICYGYGPVRRALAKAITKRPIFTLHFFIVAAYVLALEIRACSETVACKVVQARPGATERAESIKLANKVLEKERIRPEWLPMLSRACHWDKKLMGKHPFVNITSDAHLRGHPFLMGSGKTTPDCRVFQVMKNLP